MFVDITAQRPELGRRVQRLLEQHHELRTAFAEALVAAREETVRHVAPQVIAAIDELGEHERAETELLQEAYLTGLGTGD